MINAENAELKSQVQKLQSEVDDMKTAATIADLSKEDFIEETNRKCHEEVASLQHILKGWFVTLPV